MIADEVRERTLELGLELVALSPMIIRRRLTGNPHSTKIDVAEHLATHGFNQFATLLPKRPARAALGLGPKDKYWLHVFDALALAQVVAATAP